MEELKQEIAKMRQILSEQENRIAELEAGLRKSWKHQFHMDGGMLDAIEEIYPRLCNLELRMLPDLCRDLNQLDAIMRLRGARDGEASS